MFWPPLLVFVALTYSGPSRSFWLASAVAIVALGIACATGDHTPIASAGLVSSLCCVVLLDLLRLALPPMTEHSSTVSLPDESAENPSKAQMLDENVEATPGFANSNMESDFDMDGETKILPPSVIDHLKQTGEFSSKQIQLIESHLVKFLSHFSVQREQTHQLPKGTEVGKYRLEFLLGHGGSGQVYAAQPIEGNGSDVAIKLLRNVKTTERFNREMELVQRLAHKNVVIAYEVGEHDAMPFIVMERLSGPDLNAHVLESGPIGWRQSLGIIAQAARGLEHAHRRELIHRDVKPGNLIWDGKHQIKITDLGLATLSSSEPSQAFQTVHDSVAGTPDFMAPEQARGLGNATELSDIYALGATWYFLLTGQSRVPGQSLRKKLKSILVKKEFHELPASLAPDEVRQIVNKMTAYEAGDRYQSMAEVIRDIESVIPKDEQSRQKSNVSVLVVEDDADDLALTVQILKRSNQSVSVQTANTMQKCIELCTSDSHVDLVLLDLRLPDSAGIETVQTVRSALPDTPIVVLTGQDDVSVGESCIAAGADEFACKNDLNAHLMERLIFITLSRFHHTHRSSNRTEILPK